MRVLRQTTRVSPHPLTGKMLEEKVEYLTEPVHRAESL